jgi:hypothetical protein
MPHSWPDCSLASFLLLRSAMRIRLCSRADPRALTPSMRQATLALILGGALTGCLSQGNDYEDTRARGDLGAGDFVYGCFDEETDITCVDGDEDLPRALAVGARFDLRFSIKSGPQPVVRAPASDFVKQIEGGFQVRAPGQFACLALNGNREVIDIKHLRAAEIDEVRVREEGSDLPTTTLRFDRRQVVRLLAVPYESRGVKLGGALNYEWSSSDESVVSVESLPSLNRVRVRAGDKSGKAELRVEVGGRSFTVSVEVDPSEERQEDAGVLADASDAHSDAGSDAGADAQNDGGAP